MQFTLFTTTTVTLLFALASTSPVPVSQPSEISSISARAVPTARVQLNFESEGAAQADVPLDNSIFTIQGHFATRIASDGFIVSGPTGVALKSISCQAYKDERATQKLGKPLTGTENGVFSTNGRDVTIGALKCKRV